MKNRAKTMELRDSSRQLAQHDPFEREIAETITESIASLSDRYEDILRRHKDKVESEN